MDILHKLKCSLHYSQHRNPQSLTKKLQLKHRQRLSTNGSSYQKNVQDLYDNQLYGLYVNIFQHEVIGLLKNNTMQSSESQLVFQRYILPQSSGLKSSPSKRETSHPTCLLVAVPGSSRLVCLGADSLTWLTKVLVPSGKV
jgi:hypothetical protein